MNNKPFYLDRLDAVRDAIERLPENASVIRIYDDYQNGVDRMCMQISGRNDLTPDRTERSCAGFLWAEKDYGDVVVGWIVPEEDDDESTV